jgi:hypothetical protein
MTEFNKNYTLWYHNPNNPVWTEDSYHQILSFNNTDEYWILDDLFKNLIESGMFFIMKGDIVPIWEDNKNIGGGYISWRINKSEVYTNWVDIIGHIVTDKLFNSKEDKEDLNKLINGCSISPKKNFNILKVWVSKPIDDDDIMFVDTFKLKNNSYAFKLHQANIDKDKKLHSKKNN